MGRTKDMAIDLAEEAHYNEDFYYPQPTGIVAKAEAIMNDKILTHEEMAAQLDAMMKDHIAKSRKADEQIFERVMQMLKSKAPKTEAPTDDQ